MIVDQLYTPRTNYLYEGLDTSSRRSVMLWESAGRKLVERDLSSQEITRLFAAIEQGATAAGGNRTLIGQGKDAASAVNKAWEDLKSKMQNSGPVQGFDQKVSDVLSKIGMGSADPQFKGQVNTWVQKYRNFAKEHPIAQGAIYATLIALAGLSGAGVAGAAGLGLLKMADKLLQGERFTSAAYSGAKTGALAYGASQLAQKFGGGSGGGVPDANLTQGLSQEQIDFLKDLGASGKKLVIQGDALWYQGPNGMVMLEVPDGSSAEAMLKIAQGVGQQAATAASGISSPTAVLPSGAEIATPSGQTYTVKAGDTLSDIAKKFKVSVDDLMKANAGQDITSQYTGWGQNIDPMGMQTMPTPQNIDVTTAPKIANPDVLAPGQTINMPAATGAPVYKGGIGTAGDTINRVASGNYPFSQISANQAAAFGKDLTGMGDASKAGGRAARAAYQASLKEDQIHKIFLLASRRQQQLQEGIWDSIKGAAGKAADWAATKGKNITTKVTADKLKTAWARAGSPTDSDAIAKVMKDAGVADPVIDSVYQSMNIQRTPQTTAATPAASAQPAQAQGVFNKAPAGLTQAMANLKDPRTGKPYSPQQLATLNQRMAQRAAGGAQATTTPAAGAAQPTQTDQGIFIGGERIDPNDPANKPIIQALQKQQAQGAAAPTPTASAPAAAPAPQPTAAPKPQTATPAPATTAAAPQTAAPAKPTGMPPGFSAANVMSLPGMEKYAAKPAQAKAPVSFARGPSGYASQTMRMAPAVKKPTVPAAPAVAETVRTVRAMLETVQTRQDIDMIKRYIQNQFRTHGMISESDQRRERTLIEQAIRIGAKRRTAYLRSLAK